MFHIKIVTFGQQECFYSSCLELLLDSIGPGELKATKVDRDLL